MTDIYDNISEQPISLFRPQSVNANKHSQRGVGMLDASIQGVGWLGAVTTSRDNEVFDGSLRLERIAELFPNVNPIVIDSDGTRPIIVRRTDIESADSDIARKASVLANRVAEVSLTWDTEVLEQWDAEGSIEVDAMWFPEEVQGWDTGPESFDDNPESSAQEIDVDAFEFDCKCPKCGFEFTKQT